MRKTLVAALLAACVACAVAQDNVTISKSRLQELERKEAELKRLTEQTAPSAAISNSAAAALKTNLLNEVSKETLTPRKATPEPVATFQAPEIQSLGPLEPGQVLDAAVIAAQFQAQPQAAAQRYKGRKLTFTGVINGFDRPLVGRTYKIIFRPAGVNLAVVCDFYPPDNLRAVFSTDDGGTLVGTLKNEAEVTIAKIGQTVTVEGECRGSSKGAVRFVACHLKK